MIDPAAEGVPTRIMKRPLHSISGLSGPGALPENGEDSGFSTLHDQVYQTVRQALTVGRFAPGRSISLRSLAEALQVGIMPARDAIRRLSAEHALEVGKNRRVSVPMMTLAQFDELMKARLLLEPECAARALPNIDKERLARIKAHDAAMNLSYTTGDAEQYMAANYRFHFEIYRAANSEILVPLVESIWVRFGPFMRTVYGIVGTAEITDKHELAIAAITRGDVEDLKAAITADIMDGMQLLGHSIFPIAERRSRSR
jgi:DNA-binding GntR family transcriptional regulator